MFEIIGLIIMQVFVFAAATFVGTLCVVLVAALRQIRVAQERRWSLWTVFVLGFTAVFYFEAGMFAHATMQHARGNGNFLDGFYHFPLANGYQLTFFHENPPDDGYLNVNRQLVINGSIQGFQLVGDTLFVTAVEEHNTYTGTGPTVTIDPETIRQQLRRLRPLRKYIEIDTTTSEIIEYETLYDLQHAVARRGVSLQFKSLDEAYREARFAALPGLSFVAIIAVPPIIAGLLLLRRPTAPQAAHHR